ncbi:MAG: peptide ABC transporter substrate-binding protein [Defluviitaleaceae bacterium]|nr:peptide ABC transporter substrate-binding protein [Defluviitaleaceae bacterium]
MRKLMFCKILSAFLLAALLTGCSRSEPIEPPPQPPPEQRLTFSVTSLPTIDPQRFNSDSSYIVIKGFAEGLISMANGEIRPGVAERWEFSPDNMTVTFHLRQNARWSDGTPLTANDFLFAFRRLANPENEFENRHMLSKIVNGTEIAFGNGDMPVEMLGVSAPDNHTFIIRFNTPAPYFIYALDMPIFYPVRRDFVERYGYEFATSANKIIGNGPFVVEEYLSDRRIRMIPNEHYWNRNAIKLEEVTILVLDADSALSAFRRGELDMINIPLPQTADFLSGESRFMTSPVKPYMEGGVEWFNINTVSEDNVILTNVYFRRALNFALDRELLVEEATNNVHLPAVRIIHPHVTGFYDLHPVDVLAKEADAVRAREYLVAAMDAVGIANTVDVYISVKVPDTAGARRIAEQSKEQWERTLGINVTIEVLSTRALNDAFESGNFDLILELFYPSFNDPFAYLGRFVSNHPLNGGQFSNIRYDALIVAANMSQQESIRFAAFEEAERILLEDAAVIPLNVRQRAWAMRPNLRGFIRFYFGARSDFRYAFFE